MPTAQQYWAFISYSSKDKKWGQWLHKRLENYPIPKEFQGMELFDGAVLGKNLRPIFRDRDELSGSSELGPAIEKALQSTRFLIVLCSKNSAQSEWVNKEIADFKAMGKEGNILALILDGEPNATAQGRPEDECFPPELRYPAEPLAGDLRKEGDGKERGFLKVLAGITQLDFDKLYRRHERAQAKKRLMAGVSALTLIALFAGLAGFAWIQRTTAIAKEQETRRTLAQSDFLQAGEAWLRSRPHEALLFLSRSLSTDPGNPAARLRLASLLQQQAWPYLIEALGRDGPGWRDVRTTADRTFFVAQASNGYHQIWKTGMPQAMSPPLLHQEVEWRGASSYQFVISPDGSTLATGGLDGWVRFWPIPQGEAKHAYEVGSEVVDLEPHPKGNGFLVSGEDGGLVWLDWQGQSQLLPEISASDGESFGAFAWGPEGKQLAGSNGASEVLIISLETNQVIRHTLGGVTVTAICFEPDADHLWAGSLAGELLRLHVQTGEVQQRHSEKDLISQLEILPGGNQLLVGSGRYSENWRVGSYAPDAEGQWQKRFEVQHPRRELGNHESSSGGGGFLLSPAGTSFLTWDAMDNEVRLWSLETGQLMVRPFLHPSPVGGSDFLDEQRIVTSCADGWIRTWAWTTQFTASKTQLPLAYWIHGETSPDRAKWIGWGRAPDDTGRVVRANLFPEVQVLETITLPGIPSTAALHPDFTSAFVGMSEGGIIRVDFNAGTMQPLPQLSGIKVDILCWDSEHRLLAAEAGGRLLAIHTISGEIEDEYTLEGDLRFIEVHPVSELATAGTDAGLAFLFPLDNLSQGVRLEGHSLMMQAGVFSSCGTRLATADQSGTIQLWEMDTGQPALIGQFRQTAAVTALAFSSDGSLLAAGGRDDQVVCWTADERAERVSTIRTDGWVEAIEFLPDDRNILIATLDGDVAVADSRTGRWTTDLISTGSEPVSSMWLAGAIVTIDRDGQVNCWNILSENEESLAAKGQALSLREFNAQGATQRKRNVQPAQLP